MDHDRFELLKRQAANFPHLPGVYLMRDKKQQVIYVGKAKDLKARVRSYFLGGDGRLQIDYLLARIDAIDTIVTQTEEQAFLLERDLITKYKPRYNIRLKDDRAYLCIRIDEQAEWPRLELVRRTQNDGARYLGPYVFSHELRTMLEVVRKIIPLRTCPDTILNNRQRPCLEYQIKRCCGPCCLPVGQSQYREWVKQAIAILEGRGAAIVNEMTTRMETAADELRFEEAAAWRDRIDTLKNFQSGHTLITFRGENRDVFSIHREDANACVCIVLVRNGRISDTKTFALGDVRIGDAELLEGAIEQFYEGGREIPDEILVATDFENRSIIESALSKRSGQSVSILIPQRGSRARLLSIATMNAEQGFTNNATFDADWGTVSRSLAEIVGLQQAPRRVECVDISNFQGSDVVGALVSFFDGVADRSGYRRYNIKQQGKQDDFAAIHEVVARRLKRGMEEGTLPDLLIIDGGPGQLTMATKARDELRISLDIVGLAKMRTEGDVESTEISRKPERLYIEGRQAALPLEEGNPVTRFLSMIRDEVHRFVITFHRTKRAKRVFRSILDDISGVGPERKQRLLKKFHTIEAIGEASPENVAKAGRMPLALARKVQSVIRGEKKG